MSVKLHKHGTILATLSRDKLEKSLGSVKKRNAKIKRELAKRPEPKAVSE